MRFFPVKRRFLWVFPKEFSKSKRLFSSISPAGVIVPSTPSSSASSSSQLRKTGKTRWVEGAVPTMTKKYSHATYEFLLQRLYQVNRFSAVKLGIENMKQLNQAFGNPSARYEIVHVAGTNGKGSVSHKIAKVSACFCLL